jgi:hypothetical protein
MKRAAVNLLALGALCVPTVLQAQDEAFKTRAAEALKGFGELFRRQCHSTRPPPLGIAVVQMKPSPQLRDSVTERVTNRIEEALESEFVVVQLRRQAELAEAMKELQRTRPSAPGAQVHGFITIEPDGVDAQGKPAVKVTANALDGCQRTALHNISVGDIKDPFDDPEAFFRDAARKLPDKNIEKLVVMQPGIGIGFGNGVSTSVIVQGLEAKLVGAIRDTLKKWNPLSERLPYVAPIFADGMPLSGAWQARLYLSRSTRGIEVRVEFRDPGGLTTGDASGHFAPDLLPTNFDKPVLEMRPAKTPFKAGPYELLDVRIRVRQPSRLFCFILSPARGEAATLLYPTSESLNDRENLFGPQDEEIQFTGATDINHDQFKIGARIALEKPIHEFFYCIALAQPPPEKLTALWLENTVRARLQGNRIPIWVDPDRAREILSGLRQIDGAAEAFAEIVSE